MRPVRQGLWAAVVLGAFVAVTSVARAEERDTFFPKGTKDLALWGSYGTPIIGDDERFYSLTGQAGYYFADNHSVNLTLAGHGIDSTSGSSAVAGEISLQFRWHFLTLGKWTTYLDGGCGFIYSDHQLPEDGDGTHWNFTPQVGLGATYQLKENLFLLGGVRYFHASNAGLQGSDRHPGSNALMGYVGVMWTF